MARDLGIMILYLDREIGEAQHILVADTEMIALELINTKSGTY